MKNILIHLLLLTTIIFAQTGGVTGKVTNNSSPLPGVNILVMGTTTGTVSDAKGNYRIRELKPAIYELRYSAVGYKTIFKSVEITANRLIEINIDLKTDIIEVGEVRVVDDYSQKQDDTRTSLIQVKPEKARVLPGAVTDVFRTLQALPGVLAPNDFSSQLVIRGSGPDQNLIIMDDVEIFNPYRLYGVISMFNPEAVSEINLITGGFPSMYGDRLSAVLDVTNKQGTVTKDFAGNINASIVAANFVFEGKNPWGIPGSWLINTRRTYYDLVIEPFVKNSGLVEENVSFPNFYDVQTKLAIGPFSGHKFLINAILSRDAVELISGNDRNTPDSVSVNDLSKNDLASFAWHYTPNKNTLNKFIVSWYRNGGDSNFDSEFLDPSLNRESFEEVETDTLAPYLLGFQFESDYYFEKISIDDKFSLFWGEGNELRAGIGMDFMKTVFDFDFELDPQLEAIVQSNPNARSALADLSDTRNYKRYRTYLHNNFKIGKRLFFQPGIRVDYYDILEKAYFAPRVSMSYALDDLTTVRATWGLYYQSPGYEKLRDAQIFYDLNQSITRNLEAEKAIHYVFSIERWITEEWRAKFETYYKRFDNLIIPAVAQGSTYYTELIPGRNPKLAESWTRPVTNLGDSLTQIPQNNAFGEAYGFEFLIEKKNIAGFDRINGWVSYALAWANRFESGLKIPFRFDQRHTMNVILNYKINNWLDLGVRFQLGSGFPLTEAIGIKPRIILEDNDGDLVPETPVVATRTSFDGNQKEVIYDVDYGNRNRRLSSRRPVYHRLDLRLSATADYWGYDWVFYLDVVNVYNRSNVINYDYYITENLQLGKEETTMFPILPTIGFNLKF